MLTSFTIALLCGMAFAVEDPVNPVNPVDTAVDLDDSTIVLDDTAIDLDDSAVVLDDTEVDSDDSAVVLDDTAVDLDDTEVDSDDSAVVLNDPAVVVVDTEVDSDDPAVDSDDSAVVLNDPAVVLVDTEVDSDDSAVVLNDPVVLVDTKVDSNDPAVDSDVKHIDTKVDFKNIYHMSGATLLPGYGGGEILKAGGQIAWEIKEVEDDKDELYIYYTIGVNIDQNYGKNATDDEESDEDTEEEEDPVESPAKARIQVGLCGQEQGKDLSSAEPHYQMNCKLVEFQKDQKQILVKAWHKNEIQDYPVVADMNQSLTQPLWADPADKVINSDWILKIKDDGKVDVEDDSWTFGILTEHVSFDWDNKLEVTFYEKFQLDGDNEDFIEKVKTEGFSWNGRSYLSAFDQQDVDDEKESYAKMSIETIKYGVAKKGVTKGDESWMQDTKVCKKAEEKNAAGYLAASLGSFAVAVAVMNF